MNIVPQRPFHRASGDQTQIFHYKKKKVNRHTKPLYNVDCPTRQSKVKASNKRKNPDRMSVQDVKDAVGCEFTAGGT